MTAFRYGPVELYLVGLDDESAVPALGAVRPELDTGAVRLLDIIFIARGADGEVALSEITEVSDDLGLGDHAVGLEAIGIVAHEDIDDLIELVAPGTSAVLLVLELVFARRLAEGWDAAGAALLASERIPSPVVNAVVDVLSEEGE